MSFADAMTSFKAGDYQTAAEQFAAVTEQDEHNHKAWNALGICLSKVGNYEQAAICFENALTIDPSNVTYTKNRDKNREKLGKSQEDEALLLDDEPAPVRMYGYQPKPDDGDRFSNKLAIILAVLGFLLGIGAAFLTMMVGGLGAVFGTSGTETLVARGWAMVFLCFVGILASVIKHKQYGSIILILVGILNIILTSAIGIIPGALFIVSGYLIYREINFDPYHFIDFKTDPIKKGILTFTIILCLIVSVSSLSEPNTSHSVQNNIKSPMGVNPTPSQTISQVSATRTESSIKPITDQTTDTATTGEKNAAKKALSYLKFSAFSRDGLVKQLEFEKFTHEEAEYGVEHSDADWNEQAAKKAKSYIDFSSFSREGLIKQLEFDKFTPEQAEYGVKAVGY